MKRIFKFIVVSAIVSFAINTLAAEKMKQPTVEYSADMVMGSGQGSGSGRIYYALGGKSRTEMDAQGSTTITILRQDKKLAWILMPDQKMYMEMGVDETKQDTGADFSDCDADITSLGQDTVNGVKATKNKVSVSCPENVKYDGTMWITKDNIMMKMDTVTVVDGKQVSMNYELKNLKVGKQDSALFEIPSGYQKFSMGNMSSMFNAAQGRAAQAGTQASDAADEDYDESEYSEPGETVNPVDTVDNAADKTNQTLDTTDKVKDTVNRLKGLFGK